MLVALSEPVNVEPSLRRYSNSASRSQPCFRNSGKISRQKRWALAGVIRSAWRIFPTTSSREYPSQESQVSLMRMMRPFASTEW